MLYILISFLLGFLTTFIIRKKVLPKISLQTFQNMPIISNKLEEEKNKLKLSLKKYMCDNPITNIPENGLDSNTIINKFFNSDKILRQFQNSGACYINDKNIDKMIIKIYEHTIRSNPLHLSLCHVIINAEAEVIRMMANLYKGDENVVGNITTGGTDSIRHAVFTARERARSSGVTDEWEIILATTAHPAFKKAANEYMIRIVECDVDDNFRINVSVLKQLITNKTILIIASCPSFPHGAVDPIEDISNVIGINKSIGLHVDCCLGSMVVPYMADNQMNLYTKFGFDVENVTSISIDTHKYGFTDKGSSVILYKNHDDWRQHQIFVDTTWSGGIYATPTLSGSRSGKDIAGTWATLVYVGNTAYSKYSRDIINLAKEMRKMIKEFDELALLGQDDTMVIAFTSIDKKVNIHNVKNEMSDMGWYLSSLQNPDGIHFCITGIHTGINNFISMFRNDLKKSITIVQENPKAVSSEANMYKSNHTFGIKEFVPILTKEYWNIINKTHI